MTPHEVPRAEGRPGWLSRHTPEDWIRQGLAELARAEKALKAHDRLAGVLGLRRAAGMALNGALSVRPRDWGRTYVEHLRAVVDDASVPAAVRDAARLLNDIELERRPDIVRLTPPSEGARWVDAAKTVMAHAYAVVHGSAGRAT
jgi:HEPN domain-containing protein